jgi:hypothetical protein
MLSLSRYVRSVGFFMKWDPVYYCAVYECVLP